MTDQEPLRIVLPPPMTSACAAFGAKMQACVDIQNNEDMPHALHDAAAAAVHTALEVARAMLVAEQALDDVILGALAGQSDSHSANTSSTAS